MNTIAYKNMQINIRSYFKFIPYLLIILFIFFSYRDLPKTFFQQDEWWSFGTLIAAEKAGGIKQVFVDTLLKGGKVHATPLALLGFYLEFKFFYLNSSLYLIFSMLLHTLNSFLFFYLAEIISKKRYLAFLAALFFAVNSVSHQAVSWLSASLIMQGSLLFILLGLIFFVKYAKFGQRKHLIVSCVSVLAALLYNETAIFMFILLPVLWIILKGNKNIFRKVMIPFVILGFAYLSVRIPIWIMSSPIVLGLTQKLDQPTGFAYMFRFIAIPFRMLAQTIFPQEQLLFLSRTVTKLAYPNFVYLDGSVNPYVVEGIGLDLISFIISISILIVFCLVCRKFSKNKQIELRNSMLLALSIVVIGGIAYVFLPGPGGYVSLLEPRYSYITGIGSALIIVLSLYTLPKLIVKNTNMTYYITFLMLFPIFLFHSFQISKDLKSLRKISDTRKSFLTTVQSAYSRLSKNTIFYLQSDSAYYGLPIEEENLPVQSGFGRMLLVWYQKTENFPSCMYEELYLHDLIAEGYRDCGGRGFGYFRDYDKLIRALEEDELRSDDVIAYSWKGKTKEFTDITFSIRNKITRKLTSK